MAVLSALLRLGEGRKVKRLNGITDRVSALSDHVSGLSDAQLRARTDELKVRHRGGETWTLCCRRRSRWRGRRPGGCWISARSSAGFAPRDICAMWPVQATSTPHPAAPLGPGKAVVVSNTHDPATPYQAGVDLAKQMDASLITFDGAQHTVVFNGDACVDSAVVAFLIDGSQPGAGLRC